MDRYERLANEFVGLADTLVAGQDVVELTQQLIDSAMTLLPVAAAGVVLGDVHNKLQVFAWSSERTRLLEILQVEANVGPCLLACRSGETVVVDDLSVDRQRWSAFAERAAECDYRSVSALPLRVRHECVGALDLFGTEPLAPTDIAIGQALAAAVTIGILHQRIVSNSELVNEQLQTALNSRVIIEQAKGVLAERGSLDVDAAFVLLRAYARRTDQRLADLARSIVEGADTSAILESQPA